VRVFSSLLIFSTHPFTVRYWSPYPFAEEDEILGVGGNPPSTGSNTGTPTPSVAGDKAGNMRKANASHSRTSDLLAGSLARGGVGIERGTLWVCERCFKYMMDAMSWEVHLVRAHVSLLLARDRTAS
jgi:histone acetyltransferase MYST1